MRHERLHFARWSYLVIDKLLRVYGVSYVNLVEAWPKSPFGLGCSQASVPRELTGSHSSLLRNNQLSSFIVISGH